MALTRGADHTREDLLGPCAAGRPIPATDLAIDDGGADGVFSAPVGRVDVGGPQEGEHSRELAVEMPGEALGRRQSGRRVDEPAQAGKQAPAGPSEALLGDRVGIPPIAEREGVGEDGLHAGCPRAPRMVGTERATPAEQMCQAALVQRAGEAAIGRPSVADQHTGEVRAQDRDRIVKATPGADRIHGGLRCRERPQPVQHGTDAPAGFIRTDDGTPPDLSAESRVRGRRYPGRTMQDLSKSSRRDRQPEPVLQQCCDLLQRHAHVFVQQDRKRHGARTELYACRAQGVGGLQRVPALHAAPACDAAPDLNVEPPHDWLDDGQVFLVLGRDASGLNRPTTARARHGKRRGIRLIHPRRNRSPAATSIGGTCPPARSPAATLRAVLRKRGGLSKARASRRVELLLETLASALPSIAIACRAGQLLTQAGNLILVALDQLVAFVARRSRALVGHACVMSYPRKLYQPNSLDLLPSPAKQRHREITLAARRGTDESWEDREPMQGDYGRIRLFVANTGKTPATNVRFLHQTPMLLRDSAELEPSESEWETSDLEHVVVPGTEERFQDVQFRLNRQARYVNGTHVLFVWVRMDYCDVAHRAHWTQAGVMHHYGEPRDGFWTLSQSISPADYGKPDYERCPRTE